MADSAFDVIVVGGGPGGYPAAIRASQLGLKTAIVEREHLGGICLNWGCIPTKALLRSAEVFHLMERAGEFGLSAEKIGYDLDAVVKRSRGVAKQLSGGVGHLLKKNKVDVVMGEASLPAKGKVAVKTDKGAEELTSKNIILATGARARELPGLEADGDRVWTYKAALQPPHMPKKLLVIGSGATAMTALAISRSFSSLARVSSVHAGSLIGVPISVSVTDSSAMAPADINTASIRRIRIVLSCRIRRR